jgi:hypothetical protein
MLLTNFAQSPTKAFFKGFLRGMAAPAYMYHSEAAPAIPQVMIISMPNVNIENALASDWRAVGIDFDKVIATYEQKTAD